MQTFMAFTVKLMAKMAFVAFVGKVNRVVVITKVTVVTNNRTLSFSIAIHLMSVLPFASRSLLLKGQT